MEHADAYRLFEYAKTIWPGSDWTQPIVEEFVFRMRFVKVGYEQACSALRELSMETKYKGVRPIEVLEAIRKSLQANTGLGKVMTTHEVVNDCARHWSNALQNMRNLRGTDWVRSVWWKEAKPIMESDLLIIVMGDYEYTQGFLRGFHGWISERIRNDPYVLPSPVGEGLNKADGFTHRAHAPAKEQAK